MDAIILAAGMSRRMGRVKGLLPFGEQPMIAHIVGTLRAVGDIKRVVVVTGHARAGIEAALHGHDVQFAHNAQYENGEMIVSVQTGVRAVLDSARPFLLSLGDQPRIESETIARLCRSWARVNAEGKFPVMLPTCCGRRGHPVVFAPRCKNEILQLTEGETLKTLVERHRRNTLEVAVDDGAVLEDLDTIEDYERALQEWRHAQSQAQ